MPFNFRERQLLKMARYGQDTVRDDELDQSSPLWNPYATRRKSPNEMEDTKNKAGDKSLDGPNDGSMRDAERDSVNEQFKGVKDNTLLNEYEKGVPLGSPGTNDAPLDTVMDEPFNQGQGQPGIGTSESRYSPIGEHAQTVRMVREQDPNQRLKDNHPTRLPGSKIVVPPKAFNRLRRSEVLGPLEQAWAWQFKKG